jgi:uncharacterized protein DUF2505
MPRQFDFRSTSAYRADDVYAAMVDPDYLRARLQQIGGRDTSLLDHTADAGGARYRLRQGLAADDLPSLVRGILPRGVTVERTERWTRQDGGGYVGDMQVAIAESPASAAGGMRLRDTSDGGSELQIRADVSVHVPLIGGTIEGFVAEQVQQLLRTESAFTQQWLAGNR